jgi:hypothetical protein
MSLRRAVAAAVASLAAACSSVAPARLELPPPAASARVRTVIYGGQGLEPGGHDLLSLRRPVTLVAGRQDLPLPELTGEARQVVATLAGKDDARLVTLALRLAPEAVSTAVVVARRPGTAWLVVSAALPVPELGLVYELRGQEVVPVLTCNNASGRAWRAVDLAWLDRDGTVRARAAGVDLAADDSAARFDAGAPRRVAVEALVDVDVSREIRRASPQTIDFDTSSVIWDRAGQPRRVLLISGAGDLGGARIMRPAGGEWLREAVTPDPGGAVVTLGPETGLVPRHVRLAYRVRRGGFDERYLVRLENLTAAPMAVRLVEPLLRGGIARISAATPTPAWTSNDRAAWRVTVPPRQHLDIRYQASYDDPGRP